MRKPTIEVPGFAMAMLAISACGPLAAPPLAVEAFTARPSRVDAGESVELEWRVSRQALVVLREVDGRELMRSTRIVGTRMTPPLTETTTFEVWAYHDGVEVSRAFTVDVTPYPEPVIDTLAVGSNPVEYEAETTVRWTTRDAASVTVFVDDEVVLEDGPPQGSTRVVSSALTGFSVRLVAEGSGGAVSRSLPVAVIPPPGIEIESNDTLNTATELDERGRAIASFEGEGTVDYFVVSDVPEGGLVRAEVSDGEGGCPVDHELALLDADGRVVAIGTWGPFRFNGGGWPTGVCRRLDPDIEAGAQGLPAGTYYLRVSEGRYEKRKGDYVLEVEVGGPGCGNGVAEAGEQCDDGNDDEFDACSNTCLVREPLAVVTSPGRVAFETSLAQQDALLRIDLDVPSLVDVQVGSVEVGHCPYGTDGTIRSTLYDSEGRPLASNRIFRHMETRYGCGLISPYLFPELFPLDPGTYFVRVQPTFPRDAGYSHEVDEMQIRVGIYPGAGCGNGFRDRDEICDDGNDRDDDRCRNDCTLNTFALGATVEVDVGSRFDPYETVRVEVPATQTVRVRIDDPRGDVCRQRTSLVVLDAELDVLGRSMPGVCDGYDSSGSPLAITLAPGTYDFGFYNPDVGPGARVMVTTSTATPGCGDGVRAQGEVCDDGNRNDADACSNACESRIVEEIEPNGRPEEAQLLTTSSVAPGLYTVHADLGGTISDVFGFDLPESSSFAWFTYTSERDRSTCDGVDTVVRVLDTAGEPLAEIDNPLAGSTVCSDGDSRRIPELADLPAGRYYLLVYPDVSSQRVGTYYLDLVIR